MDYIKERCLTFSYPNGEKYKTLTIQLSETLRENDIDFVGYIHNDGYYPYEFIVRRTSKKWNDIIEIVNSVFPTKYTYTNKTFRIENINQPTFGNMQIVTI